jgi:hypothetical protein
MQRQASPELPLPHLLDLQRFTLVPTDGPMRLSSRATSQTKSWSILSLLLHNGDDILEDESAFESVEGVWVLVVEQHAVHQHHPAAFELTAANDPVEEEGERSGTAREGGEVPAGDPPNPSTHGLGERRETDGAPEQGMCGGRGSANRSNIFASGVSGGYGVELHGDRDELHFVASLIERRVAGELNDSLAREGRGGGVREGKERLSDREKPVR